MKRKQSVQSLSYSAGPPWIFSGRAFYQLHLVKTDVAKRFIPSELKIVQAFGYTLGGLYLAQYDSSPAGTFDELVVLAGTVWNPPTSCAWAARVLVNSPEACDHGKQEVGLPSRLANFSQSVKCVKKHEGWWGSQVLPKLCSEQNNLSSIQTAIDISELDGPKEKPLCQILFPFDCEKNFRRGPSISMSLPSFSGRTKEQPHLLKYSCQIKSSIKPMKTMTVTSQRNCNDDDTRGDSLRDSVIAILSSRPILALTFRNMMMHVEAPKIVDAKETVLPSLSSGSPKMV